MFYIEKTTFFPHSIYPQSALTCCSFCSFVKIKKKVLAVADGLKLLQVSIPPLKLTGQTARLACLYDLEGDALYSIKWYILLQLFQTL
jgi:hypothetical protein